MRSESVLLLPARALIVAAVLWFALGIAAAWFPLLFVYWASVGAVLGLLAVADLAAAWWEESPEVSRRLNATLPLGVPSRVELHLRGSLKTVRVAQVLDHAPVAFETTGLPAVLRLEPGKIMQLVYRVRPTRRGEHPFGPVALRVRSLGHLWWKQVKIPVESVVRVYPNFAVYSRHALQATDNRVAQTGVLKRRRRGEGTDFDQLREYRTGDSPRQIDWKATSRVGKLISREYQDERDQRILLLVDCGRRMGARDGELSHFDHALDAVLLLAYVGLHHGDAVGLMTLGGPQRMVVPRKSAVALSSVLLAVYDLEPTLEATDFERAAQALLHRERKRALVVILTNLRDEDDENLLLAAQLLGQRHLVLVASLREAALDASCAEPPETIEACALRGAALDYRARREATFRRLRQAGVLCLDVLPQELAVETVNHYLAIKAAGRL